MGKKIYWEEFTSTEQIVKMYYLECKSIREIAQYLGVSEYALYKYMQNQGLPIRHRNQVYKAMQGPPCPECGSRKSKTLLSRPKQGGKYLHRSRRCLDCGRWFITSEFAIGGSISDEEVQNLANPALQGG